MTARARHPDDLCSRHFHFRDLLFCGETYARIVSEGSAIDNRPAVDDSWEAIAGLAAFILDPVVDRFGPANLTYGFASPALTRNIPGRIDPSRDQHAAHESTRTGKRICIRGGAAVDFAVATISSEVARFIRSSLPFDRIYFYGDNRPLHVSWSTTPAQELWVLETKNGRRFPRRPRPEDRLG